MYGRVEGRDPAGRGCMMGRWDEEKREERPFVPIEPLGPEDRQPPLGHERYHPDAVSGRLDLTLIVATPLHVSSGRVRLRRGEHPPLVREMTRVNGKPCIPASTLKGVVRSVVEAITRSCVRVTDVHSKKGKWQKYGVQYPSGTQGCKNPENLCLACRMFGALGFEGHIRFSDAVLTSGSLGIARMPPLWEPARKGAAPYMRGKHPMGRKFYRHGQPATQANTPVEILTPKSQLSFSVRFENLTPAEVGVLLTALGLGKPALVLKIGGGKTACYGSAFVQLDDLQIWDDVRLAYADYDVKRQARSADRYLQAATELLLVDHLETLAEIWKYDTARRCPEGDY